MSMQNRNRITDIENKCGYQRGEGNGSQIKDTGLRETNYYV